MPASGMGSLKCINGVTHDGSSWMTSEVKKNILSTNLRRKASRLIGRNFIMKQDNDPKHIANTTKDFIRQKKWKVSGRLSQ